MLDALWCWLKSEMADCVSTNAVVVGTDLCWTAPHQSPHSAPSDRTGSAWSHPQPPPLTGQPLWSTRTPPPLECRHLTETSTATSYFCGPSAITRSPGGGLFFLGAAGKQEGETKRGLPLTSPGFVFLSHFLASCLI